MEKADLDLLVQMTKIISRAGLDTDFDSFCMQFGNSSDPVFRYAMAAEFIHIHELSYD